MKKAVGKLPNRSATKSTRRPTVPSSDKSYVELKQEIANKQLQAQAELRELEGLAKEARKRELADVVAKINAAIAEYGLEPQDLKFKKTRGKDGATARGRKLKGTVVAPKYRDEEGNHWSGRGMRPKWFNAALAAGKTQQNLLVTA